MSQLDGRVLPKPGVPKTLGILNVVFGVLLILGGVCTIGSLVAAPMMMSFASNTVKKVEQDVDARNKAELAPIDGQIAAEKDEAKKKDLEDQRSQIIAKQAKAPNIGNMTQAMDTIKDPTIMAVSYAGAITGTLLHIVLLISGIGLIRMKPIGRTLANAWGSLIIIQVLALTTANVILVVPIQKQLVEKQVAELEKQAQGKPANSPEAMAVNLSKATASLTGPMAIAGPLTGLIYPIILLILVNTPGSRAALVGSAKPDGSQGFDDLA